MYNPFAFNAFFDPRTFKGDGGGGGGEEPEAPISANDDYFSMTDDYISGFDTGDEYSGYDDYSPAPAPVASPRPPSRPADFATTVEAARSEPDYTPPAPALDPVAVTPPALIDDTFGTGNIYTAPTPVVGRNLDADLGIGGSASTGLDAFGGSGPDIGLGAYSDPFGFGRESEPSADTYDTGYDVGEVDPGLAASIPDDSDYVFDPISDTVSYDPIESGGTGTREAFDPISTGFDDKMDADLGIGGSSSTVTAADYESGIGNTEYGTTGGGSVTIADDSGYADSLARGSATSDAIVDPTVAPTFTDSRGVNHASLADLNVAETDYVAEEARANAEEARTRAASAALAREVAGLGDPTVPATPPAPAGFDVDSGLSTIGNPADFDPIPFTPADDVPITYSGDQAAGATGGVDPASNFPVFEDVFDPYDEIASTGTGANNQLLTRIGSILAGNSGTSTIGDPADYDPIPSALEAEDEAGISLESSGASIIGNPADYDPIGDDKVFSIGDEITPDVYDILGYEDPTVLGQPMTKGDLSLLDEISERLGYDDINVINPDVDDSAEFTVGSLASADVDADADSFRVADSGVEGDAITRARDSLTAQIEPTKLEKISNRVIGTLASIVARIPVGGVLGRQMERLSTADRKALADSHMSALENGATAQFDDEGNYTGFDTSTMSTFAEDFLASEDPSSFLPGGTMSDEDFESFETLYDANSRAADLDPYGMTTERGFIAEDGREFYVNEDGSVSELDSDVVDFDRSGGRSVNSILGGDMPEGGPDEEINVCEPGFEFDAVEGICMPIAADGGSEESTSGLSIADRPVRSPSAPASPTMRGDVQGLKVRGPKQFAMGGAVTPSIDNFLGSLRL
tara:strand:+ start:8495 stop:11089 length:2595 start_codon:yes stop_codon:yes gene_type:complete